MVTQLNTKNDLWCNRKMYLNKKFQKSSMCQFWAWILRNIWIFCFQIWNFLKNWNLTPIIYNTNTIQINFLEFTDQKTCRCSGQSSCKGPPIFKPIRPNPDSWKYNETVCLFFLIPKTSLILYSSSQETLKLLFSHWFETHFQSRI